MGSVPGSGRSPAGKDGKSSVLAWRIPWTEGWTENPMDRTWRATVYNVAKSPTRLSTHTRWELRSCKLCSASKKKKASSLPPFIPPPTPCQQIVVSLTPEYDPYLHTSLLCTNTGPSHFLVYLDNLTHLPASLLALSVSFPCTNQNDL